MRKQNRFSLWNKIKYVLNSFISRGLWAQILLLAGGSFVLTVLFGAVVMYFGNTDYTEAYWAALMHMLDQGTITADEVGTNGYFTFMLFVTFVGMAFTGTIAAIITAAIQGKMEKLQKGHSPVVERDHVVVIGVDGNTGTICSGILEGGRVNGEIIRLVVVDDLPAEVMEQDLKEYHGTPLMPDKHNRKKDRFRIIIRSGDPISENTFSVCSAENARAILISRENDLETVRILLALTGYLKKNVSPAAGGRVPQIIALIHDIGNMSAARAAAGISQGNGYAEWYTARVLNDDETMGQYYAQTCVQQGFPYVLDGLFNPGDASVYVENRGHGTDNPFTGKTLEEISGMIKNAIPLGFVRHREGKPESILLNPLKGSCCQQGDRLIFLADGPEPERGERETVTPVGTPVVTGPEENLRRNFLIVGWNDAVPDLLKSIAPYCTGDSSVCIFDSVERKTEGFRLNCSRIHCAEPGSWDELRGILETNSFWLERSDCRRLTNILLLSGSRNEGTLTDEKVMVLLLNLRQYLTERGAEDISVTTGVKLPQNQMLLLRKSMSDFVASSEISNHMMTQLLDDPVKYCIIKNILRPESDMIRLNPISWYVDTSGEFNFECVFRSAAARGETTERMEIPLGWITLGDETDGGSAMVLNPDREALKRVYPAGSYDNFRLAVLSGFGYFSTGTEDN